MDLKEKGFPYISILDKENEVHMKMKIKKSIRKIVCMLLVVTIISGIRVTPVYALEKLLDDKNTSQSIYHWIRVKSVEDIMAVVGRQEENGKKEMRLLLVPAIYQGQEKAAKYETYYIVDKNADNTQRVTLKENPAIAYEKDEFYTRGAYRLPYLVYEGMADSKEAISMFGEKVPTFRIYEAGEQDQKKAELLVGRRNWFFDPLVRKVWSESTLSKLDAEASYVWNIGFPVSRTSTGFSKYFKNSKFGNEASELVTIGTFNKKKSNYNFILDVFPDSPIDFFLMATKPQSQNFELHTSAFFKCYIGVKETKTETISGTVTVHNGQTKVLEGTSFIKEGAVLKVEKGGTVFISGTCINNGKIYNEGGTIVVQRGAAITPISLKNAKSDTAGTIEIKGGKLIVREGGRVVNFSSHVDYFMSVSDKGNLVNRGILASSKSICIASGAVLLNQGQIYTGCKLKNGKGVASYSSLTNGTVGEYAKKITQEFVNDIEKSNGIGRVISIKGGSTGTVGIFKNQGTYKNY